MMHDHKFALVDFNGDQLLTLFDGQTVRVAMKRVCELLGIDWRTQHIKIGSDPVLSKGMGLSPIPSERGTQETVTLPIDLMHGWLFKLNPEKVAPEAREKVIAYQRECYQVLHDYWTKGVAVNPRAGVQGSGSSSEILSLMSALKKEGNPAAQATIHALLVQACARAAIDAPDLNALAGHDVDKWRVTKAQFDAVIVQLEERALTVNLHRKPDRYLAIHIKTLLNQCRAAKLTAPEETALKSMFRHHPNFSHASSINCVDGEYRHCWIFNRVSSAAVPHAKRLV